MTAGYRILWPIQPAMESESRIGPIRRALTDARCGFAAGEVPTGCPDIYVMQADAEIQDAMASGAASWRIAKLIQRHPDYPFETRYVLLDYSLEQWPIR